MEYAGKHAVMRFDGSFAGLLCAAGEASTLTAVPRYGLYFKSQAEDEELFEESFFIRTDQERARKIWKDAAAQGYARKPWHLLRSYCSEQPGRNNHTGRVLCTILREAAVSAHGAAETVFCPGHGGRVERPGRSDIFSVVTAARRCRNQVQKMSGLIRFSELADGLWYSAISPDCDVLPSSPVTLRSVCLPELHDP